MIGIHMPRYEADTDVETVRDLISKYEITEPVAVDNEHKLKDAFQNDQGFVPAYYAHSTRKANSKVSLQVSADWIC